MGMALEWAIFSEFHDVNVLLVFSGPSFGHDPPPLGFFIVSTPETMVLSLDRI